MPYKSKKVQRMHARDRARTLAMKRKREKKDAVEVYPRVPDDPVKQVPLLRSWSKELKVPPGHPLSGQPMELPDFACDFFEKALGVPESLLCVSRKNAKSAILAVLNLAYLIGCFKTAAWRGCIVSLSLIKTRELLSECMRIIEANDLPLTIRKTPYPGRIENPRTGGVLECLSADKHAGQSGGYDLCSIDETGLMDAGKHRELVAGLNSSVSAKRGRVIHITIRGNCELVEELLERGKKSPETTYTKLYSAPDHCAIDDEVAWEQANPGLVCGIKSYEYMRSRAKQVAFSGDDELLMRAHDLNQKTQVGRLVLCTVSEWQRVEVLELPAREGRCYAGIDLAQGTESLSCFVAYWPQTGRMEVRGALPRQPDPLRRGKADGCGNAYVRMVDEGSLMLCGDLITDVQQFLSACFDALTGCNLVAVGADRYRKNELLNALAGVNYSPSLIWRGTGAHAAGDGSFDIRAFRKLIQSRKLRVQRNSVMWTTALRYAELVYPDNQNPKLKKTLRRGRIDALQAAVIAAGLAELDEVPVRRTPRFFMCS